MYIYSSQDLNQSEWGRGEVSETSEAQDSHILSILIPHTRLSLYNLVREGTVWPRPVCTQLADSPNPTGGAASKIFYYFSVAISYRRLVRDTAIHPSANWGGGSSTRSGAAADVGLCLVNVNPTCQSLFLFPCSIAFLPRSGE